MKRRIALVSLLALAALLLVSLSVLSTPWVGTRLCALASDGLRDAAGLPLSASSCRIDPFRMEVVVRDVALGPADAPIFTADEVRARLAALQALGGRLRLDSARLVKPRLVLRLQQGKDDAKSACPPAALDRIDLRSVRVQDGSIDLVTAGGAHVVVEGLDARLHPTRRLWKALARGEARRVAADVQLRRATIDAAGRHLDVQGARARGVMALDLSMASLDEVALRGQDWKLDVSGRIDDLCHPRVDLTVKAGAPLPMLLALAGKPEWEAAGSASADVHASGSAWSPEVRGDVKLERGRIGQWMPGDLSARLALRGRELAIEAVDATGRVGGRVAAHGLLRFGEQIELEAEADLTDVELAEVLERCKLPDAWVMLRATGKTRVKGTVRPLALKGDGKLELRDFRSLSGSWQRWTPGAPTIVDVPTARLESQVVVSRESVRLEHARLAGGRDEIGVEATLYLDSHRGYDVRVDGGIDLDVLRHVSSVPIAGRATVAGTVRAAPYGNPRIDGTASARDLHFLQLALGNAEAIVGYGPHDHVIHVSQLAGARGQTRWSGSATVDVGRSPVNVDELRLAAEGRMRDLFDAVMPWLPSTKIVRDALDGPISATAEARGPAQALDAEFTARGGAGTLLGRSFDAATASGSVVQGARAVFREVELRRGSGRARAQGTWAFAAPFPWSLDVAWTGVAIPELVQDATWAGQVDGTAALRGSLDVPDVSFDASGANVVISGLTIGAGKARGTLRGEAVTVQGTARGLELRAEGRTAGEGHYRADIGIAHDDVASVFGRPPDAPLRIRARGSARATGTLSRMAYSRADIDLSELSGSFEDVHVASRGPVRLEIVDKRISVQPFALGGATTDLTVQGVIEASSALAIDVDGTLDLRLMGNVVPRVTGIRGALAVHSRVGGTLRDPTLVGSGRVDGGAFQFRDVPIAFSSIAGDLGFSQNRVVFDRLTAAVNGGRAEISGDLELQQLVPSRVRIAGDIADVALRIPEFLPSTVSGEVRVAGTWTDMLLSGRLHVLRARYTERVDLEKNMIDFRRRVTTARPYDATGEWLRFDVALLVDGDARVDNDLVRAGVRGELALTGTLAAPGLVGTLTLTDGSRGTFRGNEFSLTHAVVDFTDRRAVAMSLDVHGETQVREYQVFMHLYGPYEKPQLQLTSQPALTQPDIITLLSLGFTTRDAAVAGGVGGVATAAAAQALFSVSGLDQQVKRFLPEGGPLRDFSVRMTSAYSEQTGQVEPRAEFESKLLDEKLRLRWQAPLSGARGQRAQAEMKVGGRASLQYQWDNDHPDVAAGGDHGVDLKLRWEWTD
ncbi:MAG TPA: translocation/assembly module TamB domain-containing protein [Anaeromyxobacteraceae bacterium]|nr:translocation/assembly module TamB domain-containing protein [Anaeromyxobacteraceae bacterium]